MLDKYYLEREDTLILVVDIQERLLPAIDGGHQLVERVKILLESAKVLKIPVLITEQYPKGLGKTIDSLIGYLPEEGAYEKVLFSACTQEVREAIKKAGKTRIVVVGMETHVCIFQTVRALLKDGYLVQVPEDAVSSRTAENRTSGLSLIREMGAVVTNTETLLFDLLKKAGSEEFRQISRLIK